MKLIKILEWFLNNSSLSQNKLKDSSKNNSKVWDKKIERSLILSLNLIKFKRWVCVNNICLFESGEGMKIGPKLLALKTRMQE